MKETLRQSYKLQAVEQPLNSEEVISNRAVARSLGIGNSTLHNWIPKSRKPALGARFSGACFQRRATFVYAACFR